VGRVENNRVAISGHAQHRDRHEVRIRIRELPVAFSQSFFGVFLSALRRVSLMVTTTLVWVVFSSKC